MMTREALEAALEDDWHHRTKRKSDVVDAAARKQLALMPERCGTCGGSGVAPDNDTAAMGSGVFVYRHCPSCHGSGKVYPQETVETIANAVGPLVNDIADYGLTVEQERLLAVAVLDALGKTE